MATSSIQPKCEQSPTFRGRGPASAGRTMVFASFALISSLGLTGWMNRAATESFTGSVQVPHSIVASSRDGHISKILVEEGQALAVNAPVALLSDADLEKRLADQKRNVAHLKLDLEKSLAAAEVDLSWRLKELDSEILQTRLKAAELLRGRFSEELGDVAWKDFLDDYDSASGTPRRDRIFQTVFVGSGLPDETRIRALLRQEEARNAAEAFAAQLELCETRLDELQKLKRTLPAEIRRAAGVQVATARLTEAEAQLELLETDRERLTLRSASFGKVGVFRKQAGDKVSAGETIVQLLDTDQRFVVVDLPSHRVAGLAAGTEVALKFPGGEKRKGRVRRIPVQTASGNGDSTGGNSPALVPVQIDPADKLWPEVPVGASVDVIFGK